MGSKEEYYELVLENRKLCKNPEILKCPCENSLCEWHGRCRECVALHRYHASHVPYCLQPLLKDKLDALLGVAELKSVESEKTPGEYRLYVKDSDKESKHNS